MKYLAIFLVFIGFVGIAYANEPEPVGVNMIEYGIFDPNGNNTHLLNVGTMYDIKAHFKSELDKQVPFKFLVRILDDDKHWTEHVEEFVSTGTLQPNESKQITFSWTPQYHGEFRTYVEVSNPNTYTVMGHAPQFDFEVRELEPEPDQDIPISTDCGEGTTYQDGICVVEKSSKTPTNSSGKWDTAISFPPALQLDTSKPSVPLFDHSFSITEKQVRYDVFYNMINASINNVQLNCNLSSLTLSLLSSGDGTIQLDIPKGMFGGIFMVLVDDEEWDDVSIDGNVLTVNFTADTSTIKILGSYELSTSKNDGVCDVIHNPPHSYIIPPLKQIKSGIAIVDVQCNEGKSPAYKYNGMRVACVSEETLGELWSRGWATMRFYTDEDTSSHALCNNYDGKWHPEHNGCRGDISDLQCSLMGGKFVDNLKICYNDICPENKTYTLCVVNSDEPDSDEQTPEPPSTPTQCRPGLPTFTTDFYLDKESCEWKLIPEPVIDEAIPYVWNAYLHKRQIDFSPKEGSYINTDEGYFPHKETRVCSPLILSDGTEQYISSTFTVEPFEIIDTVMSETKPDDCHKIWKTDTLLVEPSPELGAWLEKYWEKEDEN